MKKQCIQDMLALIMAALVHFGAWNNMVPGLVWLGETIGVFEAIAMCRHSKPCVVCGLHIQEAGPGCVCIWGANSSCHMYVSLPPLASYTVANVSMHTVKRRCSWVYQDGRR